MKFTDLTVCLPCHPIKKPNKRKLSDIKRIVLHCTDWVVTPEKLTEYDLGPNHISSTGCPSPTYSWMIDKEGTIFKMVDETVITWHVGTWNPSSVGVALSYRTDPAFESDKNLKPAPDRVPTLAMMQNCIELLVQLCIDLKVPPTEVVGHRELPGTGFSWVKDHKVLRKTCPGRAIDMDNLRKDIFKKLQEIMREKNLYLGAIDGIWGPRSVRGFQVLVNQK